MKYFLGVDPGKTGAIACIDDSMKPIFIIEPLDDYVSAWKTLRSNIGTIDPIGVANNYMTDFWACVEKVSAMPQQGVSSMFKFGGSYDACQVFMIAAGISFTLATPKRWQSYAFGSDEVILDKKGKKDNKAMSLRAARRLFPTVDLSRKKDHNKADALHLARYARKEYFDDR